MQWLDPNPFVDRVTVYGEDDSDKSPVLDIPSVIPDFTSDDDVWDAFSDFSAENIPDFFLTTDEYDGGAPPDDLSDAESIGDGGDEPSFNDDPADSVPEVTNPFDNPDPALAWRLAHMPDEVFMAILLSEFADLELEELSPQ